MSWYLQPPGDFEDKAKVVIVGSGAGGAMAACTLAEAGIEVIVVEEGLAYSREKLGLCDAIMDLYAEAGHRISTGTPSLPVAGGKALGGSTIVNSGLCFRTPRTTLDEWNDLSDGAFADVDAYYATQDAVEEVMRVVDTPDGLLSGNDKAHRDAARKLGWAEGNIRRNTPTCSGCGQCNNGCPVGGKYSVDRELLPRAVKAGARVYIGCRVEAMERGQIYGKLVDGGKFSISGDVIVLSAGSIGTPRLLLDSGLVQHKHNVGAGLRLQPVISTIAYLPGRRIWTPGATQGHFIDEFVDEGILYETNPTIPGGFSALPGHGSDWCGVLSNAGSCAATGGLIRDQTDGRVLRSRGSGANIHYDMIDADRVRLLASLRHAARLWFDGAGAEWVFLGLHGAPLCRSVAEVDEIASPDTPASRIITYSSHPQSSCGIGRATDSTGQLLEVDDVYCIDASALPSNVGRNPQISVMTVSRILAERLAERLGGSHKPLTASS